MELDSNIPEIDEQGDPKKVLSEYDVHTISLVDKGALGRNFAKMKSEDQKKFLESKEGQEIMSKIEKAKALDEDESVKSSEPEAETTAEDTGTEEKQDKAKSEEQVSEEVQDQEVTEGPVESEGSDEGSEDPQEDGDSEPETEAQDPEPEAEEADEPEAKVTPEEEGQKTEKAKMYTTEEYLEASKSALDGVAKLVKDIKDKAPEADHWEVFDIVYKAVWDIDDAEWFASQAQWDKVWNEVWDQVSEKVQKAKSLKVSEAKTEEEKIKALEALDPSLAELVKQERAKSLKAEEERQAMIKAKAYEQASNDYKRISSDDCSTNDIADAMLAIEQSAPEQHAVLSKALENASRITMAGELFEDKGSDSADLTLSPEEYVEQKSKAKALELEKNGEAESVNMAALRAEVRGSSEYEALYC